MDASASEKLKARARPERSEAWRARQNKLLGYAFALGAALSYAGGQLLTRQNVDKLGSPLAGVVFAAFFGMIALVLINARSIRPHVKAPRAGIVFFAIAGIFANMGVTSIFFALSKAPIVVVSPIISISPLISLLLAHVFLRKLEKITLRIYVGASLVVLGVIVIALGQAR